VQIINLLALTFDQIIMRLDEVGMIFVRLHYPEYGTVWVDKLHVRDDVNRKYTVNHKNVTTYFITVACTISSRLK